MELIPGTPFPDMFDRTNGSCDVGCLCQGDIIRITKGKCDFFDEQDDALGYLIASNTCDLQQHNEMEWICLVPIYPYDLVLREFLGDKSEQIAKKLKNGKTKDAKSELEETMANIILKDSNYVPKFTFFISPLIEFNNMASIAYLDDIRSTNLESKNILLDNKICSIKSPWREQLGYKLGNLFNRASTFTPESKDIRAWWIDAYNKEYEDTLKKIFNH
jgi:hypothetical protein